MNITTNAMQIAKLQILEPSCNKICIPQQIIYLTLTQSSNYPEDALFLLIYDCQKWRCYDCTITTFGTEEYPPNTLAWEHLGDTYKAYHGRDETL